MASNIEYFDLDAITSVASKLGCTAETLRKWVRQADSRFRGNDVRPRVRAGLRSDERERLKELERENRELRRANEILRKAPIRACGRDARVHPGRAVSSFTTGV